MNSVFCLVVKHKGKRPLARRSCSEGDNIKVYIEETVYEGVDWT